MEQAAHSDGTARRSDTSTWRDTVPPPPKEVIADGSSPTEVRLHSLGPYRLLRVLGEGGMARVYIAEHSLIGKHVAIKTLLPRFATCPEARQMLLREARIAASLRHPNLVDVYDFAADDCGRPYYVMELAGGETLADRLDSGPLLLSQALDIIIRLTDAVASIHRAGYLHRDIKSDNVLLVCDGRRISPKLVDFGIAMALDPKAGTSPEGVVGTPRTMAPEQISQDIIDERTDVWALGVLLYEMLTGQLPFPVGCSVREDLLAIVTEPPRPLPLGVTDEVRKIVEACLGKDPDDRPRSAATLLTALRSARADYIAQNRAIERALASARSVAPLPGVAAFSPRRDPLGA